MESAKEDYLASHDRLMCPSCKREQSFDEFWEKKRICSACKVRYQKGNTCNAGAFERRLKEAEEKRLKRLAEADAEIYAVKKVEYSKPKTMLPRSGGAKANDREDDKDGGGDEDSSEGQADTSHFEAPSNLLKKLAKLNSDKAKLLSAAVQAAESKKTSREKELQFMRADAAPPKSGNPGATSQGSKASKVSAGGATREDTGTGRGDTAEPKRKGDKFDLLLGL